MQWSDSLFREGNPYGSQLPGSRRGSSTIRPPATGAWLEGDDPGRRQFLSVGDFEFEHGGTIPLRIAYETWGELNSDRSNAVLILHALTGDSHVEGPAGPAHPTAGWWPGIIGTDLALDPAEYFVIAANMLGGCQGTTGPASIAPDGREYGARFPRTTIRDQVRAQAALIDGLGISRLAAVIGGSVGGMQALEWGCMYGDRIDNLVVLSAPPVIDAMTIAQNTLQADAIRLDPLWADGDYYDAPAGEGPNRGLALARRMAMLQYRSDTELDNRFGRSWQSALAPEHGHGRYAVESYLDFHGNRFTRRFDANSYVTLTTAMNTHDVGRNRGGVEAALAKVQTKTLVVGIDSDTLFRVDTQHRIAAGLPNSVTGDNAYVIESPFGHDGFLLELPEVSAALRRVLEA
ncbi:homoserine O-acetyltransferase MetX [Gulosibacter chungangensis]|uniref:Homoserine O-acetyltransferase n=1 Tax=Gulosibacter chungangensis TaxID=979746 RepID=A0A7J5BE51_9MICO|nr:homoserine O-acetyltransferase [Gulosibacter chungangensis]KAB1643558.1 homoserine O-acetyltransferase [Gulosibacter chungangensis]